MKRTMIIRAISLMLAALMLLGCVGIITAGAAETWSRYADTGIFLVKNEDTEDDFDELAAQVRLFSGAFADKNVTEEALPITYGEAEKAGEHDIVLILDEEAALHEQGYQITVSGGTVTVTASEEEGLFYGCNSLIRQLLASGCVVNTASAPDVEERALMLDIGRKHYTVDWIKEMIRELAWADMNALVLHFSEEMGLGIESKLYPWLNGRDGKLCVQAEVETDNRYLTQAQIKEIVEYAEQYHVEIIPSFDSPGHMNYIVKKFNEQCADQDYSFTYNGKTYTAKAGSEIGNYFHYYGQIMIVQGSAVGRDYPKQFSRGIDISNDVAVAFTQSLIQEYASLFKGLGCDKFDIGGDELLGWGASPDSGSKWKQLDHWKAYAQERSGSSKAVAYDAFLYYMNDLYELVSGMGYDSVRMWNDDALKTYSDTGWTGVVELNTNVEILYWTSGGNKVSTYLNARHDVYNYLDTYNYYALGNTSYPGAGAQNIYENWSPYTFGTENTTKGDSRVLGSAYCIWGDNPAAKTEEEVMEITLPMIRANGAKAWDADTSVSYTTYAANKVKTGSAPGETAGAEIWVIPDYSELEEYLVEYEEMDRGIYTDESYETCDKAAEAARELMQGRPTQAQVDAAAETLYEALCSVELIPEADPSELEAAIAEYEENKEAYQEQYTTASFERYALAVKAAKELLQKDSFTQEEVDAALDEIHLQWDALEEKPEGGTVECFISGKFKSSTVCVSKAATLQISTVKGVNIVGFEIYNDLDSDIEVTGISCNTSKSDRDNWTVKFKPTKAEKGTRAYTIYAILEDGTRSADCLKLSLKVK